MSRVLVYVLIGLCCPWALWFDRYDMLYCEKVAFLVAPRLSDPREDLIMTDINFLAHHILGNMGYQIFFLQKVSDIREVVTKQAVLFYVGHGKADTDAMYAAQGVIPPARVLAKIHGGKLLLLSSACFAGTWLKHARAGRIIITATNDTAGLLLGDFLNDQVIMYPPSLVDLLFYCTLFSVEASYERWAAVMRAMYERYTNGTVSAPVIADGIPGEVFL